MTTLLIDGDGLLYRACRAVEVEEQFGPDHHVLFSSFDDAKDKYTRLLEDLLDGVKHTDYEVYLSGSENWRHRVLPSYKGNRVERKPLCYARTKEWLIEEQGARMQRTYEADDLIAHNLTTRDDCTVVSQDKDFYTVPGTFVRLGSDMTPEPGVYTTPAAARFNHMVQALTGDRVDGYYGCTGYGPKKSVNFLNDIVKVLDEVQRREVVEVWDEIEKLYAHCGHEEEEAKVNATVAHLTHDDSGVDRPWLLLDLKYSGGFQSTTTS